MQLTLRCTVLTPVVKLWLRRKDPKALVKASLGQDPAKQRWVIPGFRVWPSDVDFNLHKSNSTYAADMDIARSNVSPTGCCPACRHADIIHPSP